MNPIIFLDIDGVLCINFTKGTAQRTTDKYGDMFDPDCVSNLKRIIDTTGADIILSSSWRRAGMKVIQNMWRDRYLPGRVVDITPFKVSDGGWSLLEDFSSRGEEIGAWMIRNCVPDNYVIIDDDSDIPEWQESHFVQTYTDTGLTYDLAAKAIEILRGK
jgi:hypothetical protein